MVEAPQVIHSETRPGGKLVPSSGAVYVWCHISEPASRLYNTRPFVRGSLLAVDRFWSKWIGRWRTTYYSYVRVRSYMVSIAKIDASRDDEDAIVFIYPQGPNNFID